jgi:aminoglycoside phosphotransferase
VSPFAAGAFNKLFLLSPDGTDPNLPSFILRVTLPVDPHLKTASEVATLSYVSNHTSIPVPEVIAYDPSAQNDLGFEWILMTRLPGVPLKELWTTSLLSWHERVCITKEISGYIRQMQGLHSNRLGSLYLTGQQHPKLDELHPHASSNITKNEPRFTPLKSDPRYSIGPVVAIPFFHSNRVNLLSRRGPFSSSSSWLRSLLHLQIASTLDQMAAVVEHQTEDGDHGYDLDNVSEMIDAIAAANHLLGLLDYFFVETDIETFQLTHDDLSTNNILIHPTTHQITGIVDWECISFQPEWKARCPPQFIYGPEINLGFYAMNFGTPIPDVPPPLPPSGTTDTDTDGVEGGGEAVLEVREYLEKMLLRRVFDSCMNPDGRSEKPKRIFANKVAQIETRPDWVLKWAKDVNDGMNAEPQTTGNDDMYFWPED